MGFQIRMKEELVIIAEGLQRYQFRNSEKLLIPNSVIGDALQDAFKKGEESIKELIERGEEHGTS